MITRQRERESFIPNTRIDRRGIKTQITIHLDAKHTRTILPKKCATGKSYEKGSTRPTIYGNTLLSTFNASSQFTKFKAEIR